MSDPGRRRRLAHLLLPGVGLVAGFGLGRLRLGVPGAARQPHRAPTREQALRRLSAGEPGAGGYFAAWDRGSRDAAAASHVGMQYAGIEHQSDTAITGMWLFLATELLFFGGLFFIYAVYRGAHWAGTAAASRHTELAIGTVNTVLLLTGSAVFSYGLNRARRGFNAPLFWASLVTAGSGIVFMLLKAYEWKGDFDKHLFPGPDFAISGPDAGTAKLFWCFYFIATALHGLHMIVGIGLVGWIAKNARQGRYSKLYYTPVEVVGLYWSFVDLVWLMLYPMIYLVGRAAS